MAKVTTNAKAANAKAAKKVPRTSILDYSLIEHGELITYIVVIHLVLGYLGVILV